MKNKKHKDRNFLNLLHYLRKGKKYRSKRMWKLQKTMRNKFFLIFIVSICVIIFSYTKIASAAVEMYIPCLGSASSEVTILCPAGNNELNDLFTINFSVPSPQPALMSIIPPGNVPAYSTTTPSPSYIIYIIIGAIILLVGFIILCSINPSILSGVILSIKEMKERFDQRL